MIGFECLGSACEDTCCQDWQIPVYADDLVRLRSAFDASPAGRPALEVALELRTSEAAGEPVATLRLREDHHCHFLDAAKLCGVHAAHGEPALPVGCSMFPRWVARLGDRLELHGELSCPEVVRRSLLDDQGLELIAADAALLGRGDVRMDALGGGDKRDRDSTIAEVEAVRGSLVRLLATPEFPAASRLFFAARLAHEARDVLETERRRFDARLFAKLVARIEEPTSLNALHERLEGTAVRGPGMAPLVLQVLTARADRDRSYAQLMDEIVAGYLSRDATLDGGAAAEGSGPVPINGARLWGAYLRRRAALPTMALRWVDRALLGYARSYLGRQWHTGSPDLVVYLHGLLARLAALRFLLVGHPGIDGDDPRAAVVNVVYRFARAMDHNDAWAPVLAGFLLEGAATTLDHALALIKT